MTLHNQEQLKETTERLSRLAKDLAYSAGQTLEEEAALEMRSAAEELDSIRHMVGVVLIDEAGR